MGTIAAVIRDLDKECPTADHGMLQMLLEFHSALCYCMCEILASSCVSFPWLQASIHNSHQHLPSFSTP